MEKWIPCFFVKMFKLYLFQLHVVILEGSWRSLFQRPHLSHDSWRLLRPSRLKKVIFCVGEDNFRPKGEESRWCKRQLEKSTVSASRVQTFEVWQPEVAYFWCRLQPWHSCGSWVFACFLFSVEAGVLEMHPRWRLLAFLYQVRGFDWSFFVKWSRFLFWQRSDSERKWTIIPRCLAVRVNHSHLA